MSRIVDAVPTAPEQVAQLRHAERDLSAASLVLLASQNGQHRVGQHSQCDVPIPALPVANFVVIQSAYELLQMREQRIGAILNNSSISGLVGIDGRAMYHAGKHGALGLTESAALDYAARVSASMRCAREVIDTPIVAGMLASQAEAMKELMKDVPIGRLGRPEEIAAAVLWLQTNPVTGRCEKIDFKIRSGLRLEKIALECPISDRWAVGKHLGSKIKSRKLKEINFFTSSRRNVTVTIIHQSIAFSHAVIVCHQDSDFALRGAAIKRLPAIEYKRGNILSPVTSG